LCWGGFCFLIISVFSRKKKAFLNAMPATSDTLERLLKEETQLKARIQQAKARIRTQADKVRTGRLIAWGVVIEQKLNQGDIKPEEWTLECQKVLSGRTLERSLTGPLEGLTPEEKTEGGETCTNTSSPDLPKAKNKEKSTSLQPSSKLSKTATEALEPSKGVKKSSKPKKTSPASSSESIPTD
jgi:ADP-ribose pyrophosphatase YjhB (NUDIX family)